MSSSSSVEHIENNNEKNEEQEAPKRSGAELRRDIQQTRRELAETLNALEYKLDVPARFGEWTDAKKQQFVAKKNEDPTKVYGLLGAGVAGVAGIIAGAIMLGRRDS